MTTYLPSFEGAAAAGNAGEKNPLTATGSPGGEGGTDTSTASSSGVNDNPLHPDDGGFGMYGAMEDEHGDGHGHDLRLGEGTTNGIAASLMSEENVPIRNDDEDDDDNDEAADDAAIKAFVEKPRYTRRRTNSFLFEESKAGRVPLTHTQSSFWEDAKEFKEGTIPQSVVIALAIGILCGVAAFIYYKILFFLLDFVWHTLPEMYVMNVWPENLYVLWIPIIGFLMAILVGLSVQVLGEPGDLAYTIKCVHDKAYVSMSHVLPMVAASQFSILGGGSLGPEAPLVAICASLAGYISRKLFKQTNRNVVRKHTLMGMAGALAAFFGCPLGGSLFALEVNSRFGVEYFEHMVEAIFCGEVCVGVFRALSRMPIDPIWVITLPKMDSALPIHLLMGAFIGIIGAGIAAIFASFHWRVMDAFAALHLLDNKRAVPRALLGATVIVTLGMLVPHTMFWGEYEFQTIATMGPASELEHVWPTRGLFGFEMSGGGHALIIAFAKLLAISFTVAGGYRGGFIFPFFAAGAAFGRAFVLLFPQVPVALAVLSFAAAINVAITRTSLATPLILCFLAGEQCAISGVLAASLVSLFATSYMPFIKTQNVRQDLDSSIFFVKDDEPLVHNESDHGLSQRETA